MIGQDIVDLLKLWARIPKNPAFTQLFLHQQIYPVIKQFYTALTQSPSGTLGHDAQKLIDSNILKVKLIRLTLIEHV